ncbi:hypothetical protein CHS0354_033144 [Potamilus streckersoni]|uniref:TGF-beta-activated kinase 1 and MAP3K7-binding protein 1 n=1 Tax=Potamilus streckersoni TaxID=2493646 RepID=A0AAE0VR07_9BIVA|nr:hypothetical protein CHS0354_033144 [Potamilus streckersoni]
MANPRLSNGSAGSPPRLDMQGSHSLSWTDDLPVCRLSGVGFSTNQIYREDGNRREEHEFEDKSFHFRMDDIFLYGVFDGHDSARASNFAAQRMPAELLLGQLQNKTTDEEIKEVLYQAFIAVEKSFFESIDDLLAEKTTLHMQLPEGMSYHEAYQQYPETVNKLHELNSVISGGTTASVVLIYHNKIYLANVGDTRVLLVKTDKDGILRVSQLSVDHVIYNEDEQRRLATLGLDVEKLYQLCKIGTSDCTRCIGDYSVKGGYKDIDILSPAVLEPVIAEPFVSGGIPIDSFCSFLLLMSDGLYHALQEATGTEQVNAEIASMVAAEFAVQSTLNGVAQALVDKVVRIHHDTFMMGSPEVKRICQKRGDITLMVRNFNYILPNAIGTPTGGGRFLPVSVPYYQGRSSNPPTVTIPTPPYSSPSTTDASDTPEELATPIASTSPDNTRYDTATRETNRDSRSTGTYSTSDSTQSSGEVRFPSRYYERAKLELDENGKIEAYVDFSDFYKAIEELTEAQRENLDAETKPKSGYETITEESDFHSTPENYH